MRALHKMGLPLLAGFAATSVLAADPAGPPVRDPHTAGYVQATELPDGQIPSPDVEGNFIIGPTHTPAPEMRPAADVPRGPANAIEVGGSTTVTS